MWKLVFKFALPIGAVVALTAWLLVRKQANRGWSPVAIRLATGCWVIAMTGLLSLIALIYSDHPRTPDDVHRFAYNLHGTAIFLTREERSALSLFEGTAFGGVIMIFGAGALMVRRRQASDDRKYIRARS